MKDKEKVQEWPGKFSIPIMSVRHLRKKWWKEDATTKKVLDCGTVVRQLGAV